MQAKKNGYKILYMIDSINVKAQLLFVVLIFFFLLIIFDDDDQMMLFLVVLLLRLLIMMMMVAIESIYKRTGKQTNMRFT